MSKALALRASAGVVAVAVVAGLAMGVSASRASDDPERGATDLVSLARAQTDRLDALESGNEDLRAQIAPYLDAPHAQPARAGADVQVAAGSLELAGPGLTVSLTDAPVPDGGIPDGYVPDDYVVHQQDVEGVINALWAGGAEAMTIQGVRVAQTTAIRCVGNVLYVGGRTYSPPFEIAAIGDVEDLEAALDASPAVTVYRQWAELIGLGFDTEADDELVMPASTAASDLSHARALDPDPTAERP